MIGKQNGCWLWCSFVCWVGPQCVLSCAKENRALPKQGYTCCFAMDGVKVLASGFEADEKVPCLWYVYVFLNFMCELLKKVAPVLRPFESQKFS